MIPSKDSTPKNDAASSQNTKTAETVPIKSGAKRGRKRIHPPVTNLEPESKRSNVSKIPVDLKNNKEQENKNDKIQLQELYYATMEGDKNLIIKEHKSTLYFKVCFIISNFVLFVSLTYRHVCLF